MSTFRVGPMKFGEVLDATFRIYRKQFLPFFLLGLLFVLPSQFVMDWFYTQIQIKAEYMAMTNSFTGVTSLIGGILSGLLLMMILYPLFWAAVTEGTRRQLLENERTTFKELIQSIPKIAGKSILTNILYCLFFGLVIFFIAVLIAATMVLISIIFGAGDIGSDQTIGFVMGALFLFFVLPILFFTISFFIIRFCLYIPVIVNERNGYIKALQRSWVLTRWSFWRTFGLVLLVSIVAGIIEVVPMGVSQVLAFSMTGDEAIYLPTYLLLLITLLSGILISLTASLLPTLYTVIYFDRRARREGMDLEWALLSPKEGSEERE
ncbi:hypothetical protein [Mechercharimyces sp. CAU 1602]|uniref:hypothetical protein n=1 Tax=Mechercharimyces sp. CAU 1602 TaxID=2973933 RepID=UPI00216187A7|nr:hypothetical protein [Mechercharimyces sp. CAU 1602]MCS1351109.1 hypothetical protein [Mechercharimyces sp. CAU 1602]